MKGSYSQRSLQRNKVLLHTADSIVGNGGLAILENGGHINGFPFDRGLLSSQLLILLHRGFFFFCLRVYICCRKNVLDGLRNLGTDTITLNQSYRVFSLYKSKSHVSSRIFPGLHPDLRREFENGVMLRSKGKSARGDVTYVRTLLSLELSNSLVGGSGIASNLNTCSLSVSIHWRLCCPICKRRTWENGDGQLGATRTLRRHWRDGATKARAEIIVSSLRRDSKRFNGAGEGLDEDGWEGRGEQRQA